MPTFPITDNRSGKKYQMPWDNSTPPTEDDALKFIHEQERPKGMWEKANTPLVNIMDQPMKDKFRSAMAPGLDDSPWSARLKGFAEGAGEGLTDTMSSLTSPLSLGLMALTGGGAAAETAGFGRTASTIGNIERGAGFGLAGHGAYRSVDAIKKRDLPELAGAVAEMAGGLSAGTRPRVPLKVEGEMPGAGRRPTSTSTAFSTRPTPRPSRLGLTSGFDPNTPIDADFSQLPDREVSGIPDRPALPPAVQPGFYGRDRGGMSVNLDDLQTPLSSVSPKSPQEAAFNALIPERYKPIQSNTGTLGAHPPIGPIEEGAFTGAPKSVDEPTPRRAAELAKKMGGTDKKIRPGTASGERPMLKFSEDDLRYLAQQGDNDAIQELGARRGEGGFINLEGFSGPKADETTSTATRDWVNERKAGQSWGRLAKKQFADLKDPELVDKYQQGDRSGRLADVQKFQDALFNGEVKAGILDPTDYKESYFQQLWKDKPEDVTKVYSRIAKTPGFAKTSTFDNFAQGKAAGLTPKFDTIPDLIEARVAASKKALANQKFRNYLIHSDQMHESAGLTSNPNQWGFQGPNSEFLKQKIANHLNPAKNWSQVAGEAGTFSKNLTLMGGIPGTTANVHGYNIARREMMASGFVKGTKGALEGTFNPAADTAILEKHSGLIPRLQEKGWQFHVEDHPEGVSSVPMGEKIASTGKAGEAVVKGISKAQQLLEYPLFGRHIPARSLELAADIFEKNRAALGDDAALRKAATISNDFFGGVDAALRDKDLVNVTKAVITAPNWFETNIKLGIKGLKAMAGKEDPIYAKGLARQVVMRLAKEAPIVLGGGSLIANYEKDRPGDTSSLDLGKTASGKTRELPMLGTAAEDIRLPEETGNKMIRGDLRAAGDIAKNRLNPIFSTAIDLGFNHDRFGRPLGGKDSFGRRIPFSTSAGRIANEVTRPFQPQQLQALGDYALGGQGLEESVNQALEGPLKYSSPVQTGKKRARRKSR